MYIARFQIENYKSFRSTPQISLTPGFNVVVGQNNVGKTALVEALRLTFDQNLHRSPQTIPARGTPLTGVSAVRSTLQLSRDVHNVVRRDFRRVLSFEASRKELRAQGVAEDLLPKPLPRITFHDLRHLHASYLARAGVPAKVAQERLGHANPAFTMRVYQHTLAGQQEAAARDVEALLLGKAATD